jgi:hypothetical protein
MTTFTTEDRIIAEKDGSFTVNVNTGSVKASPPHIVDSGASVINNEPVAWLPKGMTLAKPKDLTGCIPLYTHPAKTLTDEEITEIFENSKVKVSGLDAYDSCYQSYRLDEKMFARAILRKAQEK